MNKQMRLITFACLLALVMILGVLALA